MKFINICYFYKLYIYLNSAYRFKAHQNLISTNISIWESYARVVRSSARRAQINIRIYSSRARSFQFQRARVYTLQLSRLSLYASRACLRRKGSFPLQQRQREEISRRAWREKKSARLYRTRRALTALSRLPSRIRIYMRSRDFRRNSVRTRRVAWWTTRDVPRAIFRSRGEPVFLINGRRLSDVGLTLFF